MTLRKITVIYSFTIGGLVLSAMCSAGNVSRYLVTYFGNFIHLIFVVIWAVFLLMTFVELTSLIGPRFSRAWNLMAVLALIALSVFSVLMDFSEYPNRSPLVRGFDYLGLCISILFLFVQFRVSGRKLRWILSLGFVGMPIFVWRIVAGP